MLFTMHMTLDLTPRVIKKETDCNSKFIKLRLIAKTKMSPDKMNFSDKPLIPGGLDIRE